ncbi:MAG TPA: nucleotidyltransferase family protein [Thermoanaerobaculia bacterium]|nr:nucleotidyltransferase family protein [Thermoanaerobaculia bacterium]
MADVLVRCCLGPRATIVDALRSLERSGTQIVLVVDEVGTLLGTLTDGDVRRALLSGATLENVIEPFIQRRFIAVTPEATRAEVIELTQARRVEQIPIIDAEGKLVGLHLLHEILGAIERPNWAVIMAGGKGTRLWPITENLPKPMVKVAGRPILERLVLHLIGFGIRRIFLSINHLGEIVERHFGDGSRFGCQLEYLREDRPLGTGGSLRLLPERPAEPLLVMNGDLVTQADIGSMLSFHARGGQVATVAMRPYVHVVPFGCLEVSGHRVLRMEEKPRLMQLVNAGIYVLNPELIDRIPEDEEFPLPALLESCVQRGELVHAFEILDEWIDVGQREQLRQARGESES